MYSTIKTTDDKNSIKITKPTEETKPTITTKTTKRTKTTKTTKPTKEIKTTKPTKKIKTTKNNNVDDDSLDNFEFGSEFDCNVDDFDYESDLDLGTDYEYASDLDLGSVFESCYNNSNSSGEYEFNDKKINDTINNMDGKQWNNQNLSQNQSQTQGVNLTEVFKILEQVFNDPKTQKQLYERNHKTNTNSNSNDNIIHIRKESIMAKFETQIKKQLNDVVMSGSNQKSNDNNNNENLENDNNNDNNDDDGNKKSSLTQEEIEAEIKINNIIETIEADKSFIGLSEDELIQELKNVPSQEDFDYFCKELNYGKKLTYDNSTRREKLFTIMYSVGNYCFEPKVDIKKIVLHIIKFEAIRNDLINRIIQINMMHGKNNVLDCITSDMLFTGLVYLLSNENMKIVSKNIAYYFAKLFYV